MDPMLCLLHNQKRSVWTNRIKALYGAKKAILVFRQLDIGSSCEFYMAFTALAVTHMGLQGLVFGEARPPAPVRSWRHLKWPKNLHIIYSDINIQCLSGKRSVGVFYRRQPVLPIVCQTDICFLILIQALRG